MSLDRTSWRREFPPRRAARVRYAGTVRVEPTDESELLFNVIHSIGDQQWIAGNVAGPRANAEAYARRITRLMVVLGERRYRSTAPRHPHVVARRKDLITWRDRTSRRP